MSVAEACGWALLRSITIAALALPVALLLCRLLIRSRGFSRQLAWALLLGPYLVPELLIGYAYANAPLTWRVQSSLLNELFYALLVMMRVVPVGTVAMLFAPPPAISKAALHCRRLLSQRSQSSLRGGFDLFGFWIRGAARSLFPALAVMFLLAFQDFELASRLEINSIPAAWTVKIFDAHTGGLPVVDSLKLSLLPLCAELMILIPVVLVVVKSWYLEPAPQRGETRVAGWPLATAWGYLVLALVLTCLMPTGLVVNVALDGFQLLAADFKLTKEILTSAAFSLAGGLGAYWAACGLLKRMKRRQGSVVLPAVSVLCTTPGLVGTLILSLTMLCLIQLPGLGFFYQNTLPHPWDRLILALPAVAALIVWLVPRALLLELMLRSARPREPLQTAALLKDSADSSQRRAGRLLLWRLQSRGHFWAITLLCYWAYWNLTIPAILIPAGMATAPLRLYNFMHYSQSAVLSAMLCATMIFPVIVLLLAKAMHRPLLRWFDR